MTTHRAATTMLLAAGLSLAGCSVAPSVEHQLPLVSLAAIGPGTAAGDERAPIFFLGAGDELGEAVFVQYVVYMRELAEDEPVYATVTFDDGAVY